MEAPKQQSPFAIDLSRIPDFISGIDASDPKKNQTSNLFKRTDEIFSRYLVSGKEENKWNHFDFRASQNKATDAVGHFRSELDFAMALFAERQDMFGMLFRYPRTVFVLSDMFEFTKGMLWRYNQPAISGNFLRLYPRDVDQIVIFSKLEARQASTLDDYPYMTVAILKLHHSNLKKIDVSYKGLTVGFQKGTEYKEEMMKSFKENILPMLLPQTIFGPKSGITFNLKTPDNETNLNNIFPDTKINTSNYRYILYVFMDLIDQHSRNSFQYVTKKWNLKSVAEEDLLKSLVAGFITYVYPDKKEEQMKEIPKVGEVTEKRIKVITGVTTSLQDMIAVNSKIPSLGYSNYSSKNIGCALKDCNSDDEW